MKREKYLICFLCVAFLAVAGVWYMHRQQSQPASSAAFEEQSEETPASTTARQGQEDSEECAVYICGAVKHPGVYRFEKAPRVCDVVEAAGGMTAKADATGVNQARFAQDGEQIEILTKSKKKAQKTEKTSETDDAGEQGKINLNTASKEQLMTLPGIGESKAQSIIAYREENGSFQAIEDIMKISGIKEGVYNKIKNTITI